MKKTGLKFHALALALVFLASAFPVFGQNQQWMSIGDNPLAPRLDPFLMQHSVYGDASISTADGSTPPRGGIVGTAGTIGTGWDGSPFNVALREGRFHQIVFDNFTGTGTIPIPSGSTIFNDPPYGTGSRFFYRTSVAALTNATVRNPVYPSRPHPAANLPRPGGGVYPATAGKPIFPDVQAGSALWTTVDEYLRGLPGSQVTIEPLEDIPNGVIRSQGIYRDIRADNDGSITLHAGVYLLDSISLPSSATLTIAPINNSYKTVIYVRRGVNLGAGAVIRGQNETLAAGQILFIVGNTFGLMGGQGSTRLTVVNASVIAPRATIGLGGGSYSMIRGQMLGNSVNLNNFNAGAVGSNGFVFTPLREARDIEIEVTAPVSRAAIPTTATVASGTGFTISDVAWSAAGSTVTGSFRGGRRYTVTVTLTENDGVTRFSSSSEAIINGETVTAATVASDSRSATFSYQFPGIPLSIRNLDELVEFRNLVNGIGDPIVRECFEGFEVLLNADIDLASVTNWVPIGRRPDHNSQMGAFSGTFNGNGRIIRNLTIDRPNEAQIGLFGFLGGAGKIHDLNLANVNITGGHDVGAIAGYANGHIENCRVVGTIRRGNITLPNPNHRRNFAGLVGQMFPHQGTGNQCLLSGNIAVLEVPEREEWTFSSQNSSVLYGYRVSDCPSTNNSFVDVLHSLQNPASVAFGTAVTLTTDVVGSTGNFRYRWLKEDINSSGVPTGEFSPIDGQASHSYTTPTTLAAGTHRYRVDVGIDFGGTLGVVWRTSNVATVTVNPTPITAITVTPTSTPTRGGLITNTITTHAVTPAGAASITSTPPVVRWYYHVPAIAPNPPGWVALENNHTHFRGGTEYKARIDFKANANHRIPIADEISLLNVGGTSTVHNAILEWNPYPEQAENSALVARVFPRTAANITSHPQSVTLTYGSITSANTLSVTADAGTAPVFQWFRNNTASNVGGTSIDGATTATFQIPTNLTVGPYYYFVEITPAGGGTAIRSNVATVTVDPAPLTGTPTITGNICVGETLTANISNVTPATGLTYQWLRNGNNIVAATNQNYILTPADENQRISVRVTATGNYTGAETSAQVLVSNTIDLSATTPPANGTIGAGWVFNNNVYTINSAAVCPVRVTNTNTNTALRLIIQSGTVVFQNVNLTTAGTESPVTIQNDANNANVTIRLTGINAITSNAANMAGIRVFTGNTLNIEETGNGTLNVIGGTSAAAIQGGRINIRSGFINVRGNGSTADDIAGDATEITGGSVFAARGRISGFATPRFPVKVSVLEFNSANSAVISDEPRFQGNPIQHEATVVRSIITYGVDNANAGVVFRDTAKTGGNFTDANFGALESGVAYLWLPAGDHIITARDGILPRRGRFVRVTDAAPSNAPIVLLPANYINLSDPSVGRQGENESTRINREITNEFAAGWISGDSYRMVNGANVVVIGDNTIDRRFNDVDGNQNRHRDRRFHPDAGNINITFDNVTVEGTGNPFNTNDGTITLTLVGTNRITATNTGGNAAIHIPTGRTLIIQDGVQGGGELYATAAGNAAGIGSTADNPAGAITINSGTVVAIGSGTGAGIGSGGTGSGGTITITGGFVNARRGATATNGNDIGSGTGTGGTTNITGGSVFAANDKISGFTPERFSHKITVVDADAPSNTPISGATVTAPNPYTNTPQSAVITGGNLTSAFDVNSRDPGVAWLWLPYISTTPAGTHEVVRAEEGVRSGIELINNADQISGSKTVPISETRTVTFNYNDNGETPDTNTTGVVRNTLITAPTTPPTKANHCFDGWHRTDGTPPTNPWNFTTDRVITDTTLYAKWVPTYLLTVATSANGGVSGTVTGTPLGSATVTATNTAPHTGDYRVGYTVTLTATPTNATTHRFSHWTVEEGAGVPPTVELTTGALGSATTTTGTSIITFAMPANAVSLTAVFVQNTHTITWNHNDGTSTPTTTTNVDHGSRITEANAKTKEEERPRAGCSFVGWFSNSDLAEAHRVTFPFPAESVTGGITGAHSFWAGWRGISLTDKDAEPLKTHEFTAADGKSLVFEYKAEELIPLVVTVTNLGNLATGALNITLTKATVDPSDNNNTINVLSTDFDLSRTTIPSIGTTAGNTTETFTVTPSVGLNAGTYTATVRVSGTGIEERSFEVTFVVNPIPITLANINITAPVLGAAPSAIASIADNGILPSNSFDFVNYLGETVLPANAVTWDPPTATAFLAATGYTATVRLKADNNHTFVTEEVLNYGIDGTDGTAGRSITAEGTAGNVVTLTRAWTMGAKEVAGIQIVSYPNKMTYFHGDTLDLTGLAARIIYNDKTFSDVIEFDPGDVASFEYSGVPITINHEQGKQLIRANPERDPHIYSTVDHDAFISLGITLGPLPIDYFSAISNDARHLGPDLDTATLKVNRRQLYWNIGADIDKPAIAADKRYDGTTRAQIVTRPTFTNVAEDEEVTFVLMGSGLNFASKDVGQHAVSVVGGGVNWNLDVACLHNYYRPKTDPIFANANITSRPVAIGGFDISKVFDGDDVVKGGFGDLKFVGIAGDPASGLVSIIVNTTVVNTTIYTDDGPETITETIIETTTETADVNVSAVSAKYNNENVGADKPITFTGQFAMATVGTANPANPNNYTIIQPVLPSEIGFIKGKITPRLITEVAVINVVAPVVAAAPNNAADPAPASNFTVTTPGATWAPIHNPFVAGQTYTVSVTLSANPNYAFAPAPEAPALDDVITATINGQPATLIERNTDGTIMITYLFATPTGPANVAAVPTECRETNGEITGVSDLMEYRLSNASSWTAVTTGADKITGLAAGTYEVRFRNPASAPVEVTVIQLLCVDFDERGGERTPSIENLTNVVPGSKISAFEPDPDPKKDGFVFAGWYSSDDFADSDIKDYLWDFDTDEVTSDTILYAAWKGIELFDKERDDDTLLANHDFGKLTFGYLAAASNALTLNVTINNIGDFATGDLTVAIIDVKRNNTALTTPEVFELSETSITSIGAATSADFTVTPNHGLVVGVYTATVTVSGADVVDQSFEISFEVTRANGTGSVTIDGWTYGDTPSQPTPTSTTNTGSVTYHFRLDSADGDVETNWLAWSTVSPTTAAGDYVLRATFAQADNHSGFSETANFTIAQRNIGAKDSDSDGEYEIEIDISDFTFTGSTATPTIIITDVGLASPAPYNKATLATPADYSVSYTDGADRTNVGKVSVTITGEGNYTGTRTAEFNITRREITRVDLSGIVPPEKDEEPVTIAPTATGRAGDVLNVGILPAGVSAITWTPTIPTDGEFLGGTAYTAGLTLTADNNHIFADIVALVLGTDIIDVAMPLADNAKITPKVSNPAELDDRLTAAVSVTFRPTDDSEIKISVQPQDRGFTYGGTAGTGIEGTLSVTATVSGGATLSYQWFRTTEVDTYGNPLDADGDPIGAATQEIGTGAATSTFTIPPNLDADTYYFYVVVTARDSDNDLVGTSTSKAARVVVSRRTLTPAIDLTGVQGKVYDGNSNITGTPPKITLSGAAFGENPTASATFAFVDANAANDKRITTTNIALDFDNNNPPLFDWREKNYTLSATELTTPETPLSGIHISKRPVTIAGFNITKVYDGDDEVKGFTQGSDTLSFAGVTNDPASGLVSGENAGVVITSVTAKYNNASVGADKPIRFTGDFGLLGLASNAANPANYEIIQPEDDVIRGVITTAVINSAVFTIVTPAKNQMPATTATAAGTPATTVVPSPVELTVSDVSWRVDATTHTGNFLGKTEYILSATLAVGNNFVFAAAGTFGITINGATIAVDSDSITHNANGTITFTHKFPETADKYVTGIKIQARPSNISYIHGQNLSLAGLVALLSYDDDTDEEVAFAAFENRDISVRIVRDNGDTIDVPTTHLVRTLHNSGAILLSIPNHKYNNSAYPTYDGPEYLSAISTTATNLVSPLTAFSLSVAQRRLLIDRATHTRPFDESTAIGTSPMEFLFHGIVEAHTNADTAHTGIVSSEDVNADLSEVVYTTATAGTQTIDIHDIKLSGTHAANYRIDLDLIQAPSISASFVLTNPVAGAPIGITRREITEVDLSGIIRPRKGDTPETIPPTVVTKAGSDVIVGIATIDGVSTITWDPDDDPFLADTRYEAKITLTADDNHIFASNVALVLETGILNYVASDNIDPASDGLTAEVSIIFEETAIAEIEIKTQPAVSLTFTYGDIDDVLSVIAEISGGATLTYQWYWNTSESNIGGTAIVGEDKAEFLIPNTLEVNLDGSDGKYYYYVIVSAVEAGIAQVRSAVSTITVKPRQLTVSGTVVTLSKDYDGEIDAEVTDVGSLGNFGLSDGQGQGANGVELTATATYNSPNVAAANEITVVFEIDGARAHNYLAPEELRITNDVEITPSVITITPDSDQYKYFGDDEPLRFYFTHAPVLVVAADEIRFEAEAVLRRNIGETVGNHAFTLGNLQEIAGDNYKIVMVNDPEDFEIRGLDIDHISIEIAPIGDQIFTGLAITPTLEISRKGMPLVEDLNFEVEFSANINVGTVTVTIRGINGFGGDTTVTFEIVPLPITITPNAGQYKILGDDEPLKFEFTHSPDLAVAADEIRFAAEARLGRNAGETVGTYAFTLGNLQEIAGNNYKIVMVADPAEFEIKGLDIADESIKIEDIADSVFTGLPIIPDVIISRNGTPLVENVDFTVEFSDNTNVGTVTVTIRGIGGFGGEVIKTFEIIPQVIEVTPVPNQYKLFGDSDPIFAFTHAPALIVAADNAKFMADGRLGRESGEIIDFYAYTLGNLQIVAGYNYEIVMVDNPAEFEIKGLNIDDESIEIAPIADRVFTGSAITPDVIISRKGAALAAGVDFTVAYSDNINVGTATITITGIGGFSGEVIKTFGIIPLQITITPTAGQKKIEGEDDPVFIFTHAPDLIGGDEFTGALGRAAGETVGMYPFTLSTLSAGGNYMLVLAGDVEFEIVSGVPCSHVWGEWTEWRITTPATCDLPGMMVRTRPCIHCPAVNENTRLIAQLNGNDCYDRECTHVWGEWGDWNIIIPATCDLPGMMERVRRCTLCPAVNDVIRLIAQLNGRHCVDYIGDEAQTAEKYGIVLENAIVGDSALIKVIVPENSKLRIGIFDATGNLLFERSARSNRKLTFDGEYYAAKAVWNLNNSTGRPVANGAYLIIAEVRCPSGKIHRYSAKIGVSR